MPMNMHPHRWWKSARGLTLAMCLLAPCPVAAVDEPNEKLQSLEHSLERTRDREADLKRESKALSEEISLLRREMIKTAYAAQEREEEVTALERRLLELNARVAAKSAALERKRDHLAQTLGALVRIAIHPPEAIVALPGRPLDTIRSALLLRAAVPPIEDRAYALSEELAELARLRDEIFVWRQELEGAVAALQAERDRLDFLVKQKSTLARQTEAERAAAIKRMKALAEEAKDLRDLLDRIRISRLPIEESELDEITETTTASAQVGRAGRQLTKPEGIRSLKEARGQLVRPVRGDLVRGFGVDGDFGTKEKGITLEARPSAQVVAAFDGQVVFAGPFRGYGQILIIEHGGGYHSLLAGLSRLDAVVGQWVLAGEPVGLMGRPDEGHPRLYLELRRKGRPINPTPWLLARNN